MPIRQKLRALSRKLHLRGRRKSGEGVSLPPTSPHTVRSEVDIPFSAKHSSGTFQNTPSPHILPPPSPRHDQQYVIPPTTLGSSVKRTKSDLGTVDSGRDSRHYGVDEVESGEAGAAPEIPDMSQIRMNSMAPSNTDTVASSDYDQSTIQSLGATPPPAGGHQLHEFVTQAPTPGRPNLSQLISFTNHGGAGGSDDDGSNGVTVVSKDVTVDYRRENSPAITHTTVVPEKTIVTTEEITTEHHLHHIVPIIQPVVVQERLPPKHFLANPDTGEVHEISPEEAENYGEPAWIEDHVVAADDLAEEVLRIPGTLSA